MQVGAAGGAATMMGGIGTVTITELSANSLFGALAGAPRAQHEPILAEQGG
jgi:hypothetical protein